MTRDPRMRLRFYVDGTLADETWVDITSPAYRAQITAVRLRHETLAAAADATGKVWLAELYDPDQPDETAYIRFGTDQAGMIDPAPLVLDLPRPPPHTMN